jgi:hypothetical protein
MMRALPVDAHPQFFHQSGSRYQTVHIEQARPQEIAALILVGGILAGGFIGLLVHVIRKR